jgi:transcription elongation factor Elf1
MEFECECGHVETMALTTTERLALNDGRAVFVCPACGRGHDREVSFPVELLEGGPDSEDEPE